MNRSKNTMSAKPLHSALTAGPVPGPGNPTGQQGGQQGDGSQQGQQGGQQGSGQGGQDGSGSGSSGNLSTLRVQFTMARKMKSVRQVFPKARWTFL